jgi:hypothetical protein
MQEELDTLKFDNELLKKRNELLEKGAINLIRVLHVKMAKTTDISRNDVMSVLVCGCMSDDKQTLTEEGATLMAAWIEHEER